MTQKITLLISILFSTALAMGVNDSFDDVVSGDVSSDIFAELTADELLETNFDQMDFTSLDSVNLHHNWRRGQGNRGPHANRSRRRGGRMHRIARRHRRACYRAGVDRKTYQQLNTEFKTHFKTLKPLVDTARKNRKAWRKSIIDETSAATDVATASTTLSASMSKVIAANKKFVGQLVKKTFKGKDLKPGLRCVNSKLRMHRLKAKRKARRARRQARRANQPQHP